jgi:hypothetical protein
VRWVVTLERYLPRRVLMFAQWMDRMEARVVLEMDAHGTGGGALTIARQLDAAFETCVETLVHVFLAMEPLLGVKVSPQITAVILSTIVKGFETVTKALPTRWNHETHKGLPRSLVELARLISNRIEPRVYAIILTLSNDGADDAPEEESAAKRKKLATSAVDIKARKMAPTLVRAMEAFETRLIAVGQAVNDTSVIFSMRRTTSRDFKLDAKVLQKRFGKDKSSSTASVKSGRSRASSKKSE